MIFEKKEKEDCFVFKVEVFTLGLFLIGVRIAKKIFEKNGNIFGLGLDRGECALYNDMEI